MASITSFASASRTCSQVGNFARKALKPRSRLISLVFCERIVETSSSMTGSGLRQIGSPKTFNNVSWILIARFFSSFMDVLFDQLQCMIDHLTMIIRNDFLEKDGSLHIQLQSCFSTDLIGWEVWVAAIHAEGETKDSSPWMIMAQMVLNNI